MRKNAVQTPEVTRITIRDARASAVNHRESERKFAQLSQTHLYIVYTFATRGDEKVLHKSHHITIYIYTGKRSTYIYIYTTQVWCIEKRVKYIAFA